ncbi:S24/S26 family peptidase [Prevotella ihumii]|uniref:S24/S26 family peptidase n=1 Tax=Prevotella ihumii TaxID=1917878 RepID=UPI000981FFD3|nr:S24/S26 family peptidase [Prevotella ihumii]
MRIEKAEKQFENASLLPEVVKMLQEGHTVTLRLKGYSMRPFLENNRDKALLVKPTTLRIGDPVLAEIMPKHFVLHRIIRIENDDITLLGDGNLSTEYCKKENIVGAVIGFYRKGRNTLDRTDGRKWRIYSKVWTALRPFRRILLGVYRRLWIPLLGTI